MARAVGVIRLSLLTEGTTSLARQRGIITAAATTRGSQIVGWAEDLDVSASKIHPMKRPELAAWLARQPDFDELIWAQVNGKGLASATEPFDLATPMGRAMAYLTAIFAEMETAATSVRVAGSHEYLRRVGRWGGGKPPYGYQTIANPHGNGVVLVVDQDAADVVAEDARRVLAGEAVNSIIADFNYYPPFDIFI